jgi:lipocalin
LWAGDNAPVAALDMNRYLGEWYEIARFDHSFERGYDTDKLIWVRQET